MNPDSHSTLSYRLLNVFTLPGQPLTGNPLCVFEDGRGLSDELMQRLARQFNLSETTFLLPATDSAAHARVRIFTPSYEMPFAGHPTLGSAAVCRSLGLAGDEVRLEMTAGRIDVRATGARWTLAAPTACWREVSLSREELACGLGLSPQALAERPLWVTAGTEQLIVPLTSVEALQRATARPELFRSCISADGQSKVYVFALESDQAAQARFFFPQGAAVLEDPATGSATANLGGWWIALQRPRPCRVQILQGVQTGRPSRLHLDVNADGRITVGGEVVELGRGRLELPRASH
jgi:PhzF family phenazine biosynthesis protein